MSTFAGSAQGLKDSSEATFANFYSPKQLVFDSGSNLFVVDSDNNAIRRISAAGLVTTVAGASSRGRVDGAGKDARFSQPTGMTIDDSNFLYIADTGNSLIRKMTADYVVTTIAGTGAKGSVNGISTAASFNNPEGITIDKSTGTLYVADSSNNCIRKIAWNGVVTNLATQYRDWNGVFQNFNYPTGIYYSPNTPNLMYVSDANGNYVHKVYTNGSAVVFAGSGVIGSRDGNSSRATFNFPHQIWVNKDELVYVVDQQNSAIRVIEKNGNVTTVPYYTKETSSSLSKGKLFLPVGIVGSMTTGNC